MGVGGDTEESALVYTHSQFHSNSAEHQAGSWGFAGLCVAP